MPNGNNIHISKPDPICKTIETVDIKRSDHLTNPLPVKPGFGDKREALKINTNDIELFISLLGDFRYLADSTQLDIAYATSCLVRHTIKSNKKHIIIVKLVIHYLVRTIGLRYMHGASDDHFQKRGEQLPNSGTS